MSAATERGEIGPLSMQPCETARCFAFREKSVSSSSLARDFREADGGPEPFSMVLNHITSGLKAWSNKRTVELSLQIAKLYRLRMRHVSPQGTSMLALLRQSDSVVHNINPKVCLYFHCQSQVSEEKRIVSLSFLCSTADCAIN